MGLNQGPAEPNPGRQSGALGSPEPNPGRQSGAPAHGNGKQYAAHRRALGFSGATPAAVTQAKNAGRISPPERINGQDIYDFAKADAEWAANTKSQHRGWDAPPPGPTAAVPQPPPPGSPGPARTPAPPGLYMDSPGALDIPPDRRIYEAWMIYWRAERERMEAQKMAELLIERESAVLSVAKIFRSMRDQILSIPSRIRTDLANADNPDDVEQILRTQLYRALEEPDFSRALAAEAA